MLKTLRQARAALNMLRPEEVRKLAERPVTFGLVSSDDSGYIEMENFLLPDTMERRVRLDRAGQVHRAGEPNAPENVDIVLYQHGIPGGDGVFSFHGGHPDAVIAEILKKRDDLALPLARQFPFFRKPVVEDIIQSVSRENALFAITTALPNVVPSLIEIPWVFGEFASDTLFLTANQVRMAFAIGAAAGREIGMSHQKAEIFSLAAGAFGWRTLARELVGLIPLGQGLIPKGVIAYAATFLIGKGLEHLYAANVPYTREQSVNTYKQALERGRSVLKSLRSN
jgi:uncharacterized protein (DUF697 family)